MEPGRAAVGVSARVSAGVAAAADSGQCDGGWRAFDGSGRVPHASRGAPMVDPRGGI